MIHRFVLSGRAARDLEEIKASSLKTWGEEQTFTYLANIEKRLLWLIEHPSAGRKRDEIRKGLRSFPEGVHIVFYRLSNSAIEVVGLPHQRQDVHRFFTAEF